MLCSKKGYDKSYLESRYILINNKQNKDRYKAIYISTNIDEIKEKNIILNNYKLTTITPISTSITNLIDSNDKGNIVIVNIENETRITTIIDGQINRVDILNCGAEQINSNQNEIKRVFGSFKNRIDKIYFTGMGAKIDNIKSYFQEIMKNAKCEILKPFFIDEDSAKEYVEFNSAIALALDGLGYINKNLNFLSTSKNFNIENIVNKKKEFTLKQFKDSFKKPFSIHEKLILRTILAFLIAIIGFSCFERYITKQTRFQKEEVQAKLAETKNEIDKIDQELLTIESSTNIYTSMINSADFLTEATTNTQNSRVISKDAIPDMLNKIMIIIPKQVQIVSIENTENNHIIIEAVSEKYEQLGYFLAAIRTEKILENIQSTTGTKSNSLVQITIEGDLK